MRKKREVKYEGEKKLYKCSSCGEFLPRENFSQNLSGYDFISSECKKCANERIKKYRKENKDKWNEYQKEYKEKRRVMMYAKFGKIPAEPSYLQPGPQQIPEPSYPQPGPQPIPEPTYPQPGPQPAKVVVNFEETTPYKLTPTPEHEPVITKSTPVVPLTFSNDVVPLTFSTTVDDSELIIQSAIEKYPEAYTEILSDEDTLYYFNEKRSTDKKIEELQKRQEKFNKEKADKEYNIMKEKMRDLVDETLSIPEKIRFEEKLHSLHEAQQDDFVKKVSRLSKVSFPVSREAIYDALLDIQTGKNNKDVVL